MPTSLKSIFCYLLLGLQLLVAGGVVQGRIICQDLQSGETRLENAAEQTICHQQTDSQDFVAEVNSPVQPECMDTPVPSVHSSGQDRLSDGDVLKLINSFIALPNFYLHLELPISATFRFEAFHQCLPDQTQDSLRSVILVI